MGTSNAAAAALQTVAPSPDPRIIRMPFKRSAYNGGCGEAQGNFLPTMFPNPALEQYIPKPELYAWIKETNAELGKSMPNMCHNIGFFVLCILSVMLAFQGTILLSILVDGAFPRTLLIPVGCIALCKLYHYAVIETRRHRLRATFDRTVAEAANRWSHTGVVLVAGAERTNHVGAVNLNPDQYMTYLDFRLPGATVGEEEAAIGAFTSTKSVMDTMMEAADAVSAAVVTPAAAFQQQAPPPAMNAPPMGAMPQMSFATPAQPSYEPQAVPVSFCTQCGTNTAGMRFCGGCGTPVTNQPLPGSASASTSAPPPYQEQKQPF